MSFYSGPSSQLLRGGECLHLQHGPIDLIIGADKPHRTIAFQAAVDRFETVLTELVEELPTLRSENFEHLQGETAQYMATAIEPFSSDQFITPMAAVAGGVADTILKAMRKAAPQANRLYVNNGGDIALHLADNATFKIAISDHRNIRLGTFSISSTDKIGGIATSGRHGRSLSMGIADSVTTLARCAAEADAAATLIANSVDLVDHPNIERAEACVHDPSSDLGHRLVVTHVGDLTLSDINLALGHGLRTAHVFERQHLIKGCALFLADEGRATDSLTSYGPFLLEHATLSESSHYA